MVTTGDCAVCVIVVALLSSFLMFQVGAKVGANEQIEIAISHGVANWSVNPTNGVTKLEWGCK